MGQPVSIETFRASGKPTRGSETSQYPEEKKTKVISPVAASEKEAAQTGSCFGSAGVVGLQEVTTNDSGIIWKDEPKKVRAL